MFQKNYTTYIFDFDYTLADATYGIATSINYALCQMGYCEQPLEAIRKTIGMHLADAFTLFTDNHSTDAQNEFRSKFKIKADVIMLENTKLLPDTTDVLNRLKSNGFKTAIVSTKFRYRIEDVLKKFNISNLIDLIIGSEDVVESKPDPTPLLRAVEILGASKDSVLYTGDSIIDAETAYRADIDFLAVTTGTTSDFSPFPNIAVTEHLGLIL